MEYLTYEEYRGYGGSLPEAEFPVFEFRARKRIDYWTDSRVRNMAAVPEAVKLCMMQLIKLDGKFGIDAQTESPVVASFSTDGYSESYGGASDQAANAETAVRKTVMSLLFGETDGNGTPLLYRGVRG